MTVGMLLKSWEDKKEYTLESSSVELHTTLLCAIALAYSPKQQDAWFAYRAVGLASLL